jgi:hypothetical protein
VIYQPSEATSSVRASIAGREGSGSFDARTKDDIEFTIAEIGGGPDDDGGMGINPNKPGGLVLRSAEVEECTSGSGPGKKSSDCRSVMEFTNTGSSSLTVVDARVNFYSPDQGQGLGTFRQPPTTAVFEGVSLNIGGPFETVNEGFVSGNSEKTLEFYRGGEYDIADGDFYILTFVFADGERSTYFVLPRP